MPYQKRTLLKMELIYLAIWIDVSKSKHQLKLMDGDKVIKTYPIAVGKILTPTPKGTFTIVNKDTNPPAQFGVLWMGLSKPHYGIHGTNNPTSIGQNLSHGCIRMYNHDVLELSKSTPIGTTVSIHE